MPGAQVSVVIRQDEVIAALRNFFCTSLSDNFRPAQNTNHSPQETFLALFHRTAAYVPAYRAFLKEHGIFPDSIRTWADYQALPLMTKQNYLSQYPIAALCRDGTISACDFVAVSSGSTGKPSLWPRFVTDEYSLAVRFEQVFHDSFQAHLKTTLAVVCFPLGTWVGGMYTTFCCRYLAAKGYPVTIITPGNNKTEIYRVIEDLGTSFDQVVLLGYPPFLKDVIDTAKDIRGATAPYSIDWRRYAIKMVFAGEVFSEEWRDLVHERVGARHSCFDSASLYGTADGGVLGNETPLSVCIRRFLSQHPEAARELFGESRLPTLVQYDPRSRFFEVKDNTLIFSADNGIPLIRYHLSDTGGLVEFQEMLSFLKRYGFNPIEILQQENPNVTDIIRELPFVYVFGRSDFTVSFFGANIYPENISVGLEQPGIRDWVTGKFVLQVLENPAKDKYLSIVVELSPGISPQDVDTRQMQEAIVDQLRRLNSEFAHYVPQAYRIPEIGLKPAGDADYFPIGVKHRYTRYSAERSAEHST